MTPTTTNVNHLATVIANLVAYDCKPAPELLAAYREAHEAEFAERGWSL